MAHQDVQPTDELLPPVRKNTFLGKKEKFSPYSSGQMMLAGDAPQKRDLCLQAKLDLSRPV